MSTERDEAEVALIKARTGLAKSCDYAVYWLHLILCVLGGMAIGGLFSEHATACAFWRSVEAECHDAACLLEASDVRPWSCGPNDRSVVAEAVAKARRAP